MNNQSEKIAILHIQISRIDHEVKKLDKYLDNGIQKQREENKNMKVKKLDDVLTKPPFIMSIESNNSNSSESIIDQIFGGSVGMKYMLTFSDVSYVIRSLKKKRMNERVKLQSQLDSIMDTMYNGPKF